MTGFRALVVVCLVSLLRGGGSDAALVPAISRTSGLPPTGRPAARSSVREPLRKKAARLSRNLFSALNKPLRDANFWARTAKIYGSYKLKQGASRLGGRVRRLLHRNSNINNFASASMGMLDYNTTHEINSRRMIDLCLSMRGFYLKTGQFLGTRHDFMPLTYIKKLSQLHDNVPPLSGAEIRGILERDLGGPLETFFSSLDLDKPIGAASIAQVHKGVWRQTNQVCAVKVQYPNAERLMRGDLANLRRLAEFLQKTELKFDLLSAIKELQKQIKNEFDFVSEARNMDSIGEKLAVSVPSVRLPRSIRATPSVLVMTFIDGPNLSKMDEFKASPSRFVPAFVKRRYGKKLLDTLSQAWGTMLFDLRAFNADPHPGNICISATSGRIGLLDWGQVKQVSDNLAHKFGTLVLAIHANKESEIVDALFDLGVTVSNPADRKTVSAIAVTMLDTRRVKGYVIDPFSPQNSLKTNSVTKVC